MEPGACDSEFILSVSALWNLWCQDVCFLLYVFNRHLLCICSLNVYLLKATWKVVEIAFWSDLWAPGLNFILIQRVIMINHKQGSLLINTGSLCPQLISFSISLSYSLPPHFESLFLWEKCYSIYRCELKLSHFVFQTRSVWFEKVRNWCRSHLSDLLWVTAVVRGRIWCVCVSRSVVSHSLWPRGLQPARLLCPLNFPGKNTGVDCHFLLRGSFLPRDWTYVSCFIRRILYRWATWEAHLAELGICKVLWWQIHQNSSQVSQSQWTPLPAQGLSLFSPLLASPLSQQCVVETLQTWGLKDLGFDSWFSFSLATFKPQFL